jgi:hypothetical protein
MQAYGTRKMVGFNELAGFGEFDIEHPIPLAR